MLNGNAVSDGRTIPVSQYETMTVGDAIPSLNWSRKVALVRRSELRRHAANSRANLMQRHLKMKLAILLGLSFWTRGYQLPEVCFGKPLDLHGTCHAAQRSDSPTRRSGRHECNRNAPAGFGAVGLFDILTLAIHSQYPIRIAGK